MDEPTFTPTSLMALLAIAGLILGWEKARRHRFISEDFRTRRVLALVGIFALVAFAYEGSDRWSGFWFMLLMPLGAYKLSSTAGEWLAVGVEAIGWLRPYMTDQEKDAAEIEAWRASNK